MPSLITRIKELEKKLTPEPVIISAEGTPILWEEGGKLYYKDKNGDAKEYIEKEDKKYGKPRITAFILPKDLVF